MQDILGKIVNSRHPGMPVQVIGDVDQSLTGNTVLRVGKHVIGSGFWEGGLAHVVLTPEEREELIQHLLEHRENAPVAS